MSILTEYLWNPFYHYFFRGGEPLGKGWDGEDCHHEVPIHIKQREVLVWTFIILFLAQIFRHDKTFLHLGKVIKSMRKSESHHKLSSLEKYLDMFFCLSAGFGWAMLVYYKIIMRYMIYLLQPCHLTLAFHFITFFNADALAPIAALLWLPMTGGTLSAILFPSTAELINPYEVEMYWIEHALVQIIPLYLLVRKRGAIVKHFSWNHVFLGNLIVMCIHWWIFEVSRMVSVVFSCCRQLRIVFFQLVSVYQ
jgi:hypothetical protein